MIRGKFRLAFETLVFFCPGCKENHQVNVIPDGGPCWSFNGDYEKPTISPSILVKSGHYTTHHKGDDCYCNYQERFGKPAPYKCRVCHSFIKEGNIQFLGDCTHELAGKTVPLPDMKESEDAG